MSSFTRRVEQAARIPPCPYCGGRYSLAKGRIWHRGHPRDCWRKAQRDANVSVLRADVDGCGCDGEHTKDTCSRFYEYVPEAEDGEEYGYADFNG